MQLMATVCHFNCLAHITLLVVRYRYMSMFDLCAKTWGLLAFEGITFLTLSIQTDVFVVILDMVNLRGMGNLYSFKKKLV